MKHDVVVVEINISKPKICPKLVKIANDGLDDKAKNSSKGVLEYKGYTFEVGKTKGIFDFLMKEDTFEVGKTKEIFDFLMKEGTLKLPEGHLILIKEKINGKDY